MCGLVGIAGNVDDQMKKVFNDMLVLDVVRGFHSTGVMVVNRYTDKTEVVKKVGTPDVLFDSKAYDSAIAGSKQCIMGHNRWATKGAVTAANAHPFEFEHIIGAHNGTLINQALLDDHAKFKVDSENIFYHMNQNTVEDTISKLHGAYALTWWDKRDNTINFCRNDDRPLVAAYTKDRKCLIWASESWMIQVACLRQRVEHTEVFKLEVDKHYKVTIPPVVLGIGQPFALEDFAATAVTPFRKPFQTTTQSYSNGYSGSSKSGTGGTTTFPSNTGKYPSQAQSKKAQVVDFSAYSDYICETVEFVVRGTEVDEETKEFFIDAELVDDEDLNIRLYADPNSELWNELLGSNEAFQGLAKCFKAREGGYLVIDLRSVVEIPGLLDELIEQDNQGNTTEPQIPTYQGKLVPASKLLQDFCSWCGGSIFKEQLRELHWVDEENFICPHCKKDPVVGQYYNIN